MEKINIDIFANICIEKMIFLCDKYAYNFEKFTEKSENGIIQKIIFSNYTTKRIVEIVLIAKDYTTHMFTRIAKVYVKQILLENDDYSIPDYYDKDYCFEIFYIERLLTKENQNKISIMREKDSWNTFDYLNEIVFIIKKSQNIINGNCFPTINELSKILSEYYDRKYQYKGHSRDNFFITKFKETIKAVENYGYEIVYDETKLQPYERDDMYPEIRYYHKSLNILIRITFDGRDTMFTASKDKSKGNRNYWHCGVTSEEEYKKLEQKMIGIIPR
jgi:hypothetical protein